MTPVLLSALLSAIHVLALGLGLVAVVLRWQALVGKTRCGGLEAAARGGHGVGRRRRALDRVGLRARLLRR